MLALDSFKKHIHTKYCTQLDRPASRNMTAAEQKLGPSFKQTNKQDKKQGRCYGEIYSQFQLNRCHNRLSSALICI